MSHARYIIGIDLGTTNCAMAFVDRIDAADNPPIRIFSVPQLVDAGKVAAEYGLPSFLYLPGAHELPPGATALPWAAQRDYAVGVFARQQGALVPSRLVSSAKSWLCHAGVDRQAAILPWGSPSDVPRVSPVEASARYLRHLREAWDQQMSEGRKEWTVEQSDVVLTVPASFDEVARELTVRAAQAAGLGAITLLEEPQAAFYSWVRAQGEDWREELDDGDVILVCDVGGGTTDFSLIAVSGSGEAAELQRIAIGEHLMLGGDNMDLALARHLEKRLVKRAGELSAKQWGALVHRSREAKESLLTAKSEDRYPVTIAGSGSKVIGGSLRIDLFRDEALDIVLEGFFPRVPFDAQPPAGRPGMQELGLPYASDPAVTRNLATFLRRHNARPKAVLFNGGAMKATMLQDRVADNLADWFEEEPLILESRSLDLAVALGAASYGLARAGGGLRIRGGTARAYYIGAEASGESRAVCLIPFGVEEGDEVAVDRSFQLVTGRPVSFALHSTTAPLGHGAGTVVDVVGDDLFIELPPIHTVISQRGSDQPTVSVQLRARLNEIGTLNVWCEAADGNKWDLEFAIRESDASDNAKASGGAAAVGDIDLEISDATELQAAETITRGLAPAPPSDEQPRTLLKRLEQLFDAERLRWPGPTIRRLWQPLWRMENQREQSADHEAAWLNIAGLLLRPGFGDPLDAQRLADLGTVFRSGLHHQDALWCRIGWWVLWRRVAGGLDRGQQLELSNKLAPPLLSGAAFKAARASGGKGKQKKGTKGATDGGINRQELAEMWRTVASLEQMPARSKEGLGDVALRNALAGRGDFAFWALGRLGARVPLYGPAEEVVARDKACGWLDRLLAADWQKHKEIALAVVQLARRCGDDARDIDQTLRARVIDKLTAVDTSAHMVMLVKEVTVLHEDEKAQLFGDTLPSGLRLE